MDYRTEEQLSKRDKDVHWAFLNYVKEDEYPIQTPLNPADP
jgi:hypothetical protein